MYFEFEKLDVYQAALEFIALVDLTVGQLPKGYAHRKNQLLRSADSIADTASQLLVIRRQKQADVEPINQTLTLLHRIVCMLTKLASNTKDRRPTVKEHSSLLRQSLERRSV